MIFPPGSIRKYRGYILMVILLVATYTGLEFENNYLKVDTGTRWKETLPGEITKLTIEIQSEFNQIQEKLIAAHLAASASLVEELKMGNPAEKTIVEAFAGIGNGEYAYEMFNTDSNLIAWKGDIPVQEESIREILYRKNVTRFQRTALGTFLLLASELKGSGKIFYLVSAIPVERKYIHSGNKGYENFSAKIEKKFLTECRTNFSDYDSAVVNGRDFNVALHNNASRQIGTLTLKKPSPAVTIQSTDETIQAVQTGILLFLYAMFGYLLSTYAGRKQSSMLRVILFSIYCAGFRWLLFARNISIYLFPENLRNPEYFASKFAGGIVKSPAEFLLTTLLFFIVSIYIFKSFSQSRSKFALPKIKPNMFYLLTPVMFAVNLLLIRAFAASIRSVVFDSSLRYFNESAILPQPAPLLMNVCIFFVALSFFLWMVMVSVLHLSLLHVTGKKQQYMSILIVITVFLVSVLFYETMQNQPLLTAGQIVIISLLAAASVLITSRWKTSLSRLVPFIGFFSSIAAVVLMNIFNSRLEIESLKNTASDLARPKQEFARFIITDLLTSASTSDEIISNFSLDRDKLAANAFLLWAGSALPEEHIPAYIGFANKRGEVLGEFTAGIKCKELFVIDKVSTAPAEMQVTIDEIINGDVTELTGTVPVKDAAGIVGYCIIKVLPIENTTQNLRPVLPFLSVKKNIDPVIDPDNLSFAKLRENKILYASGPLIFGSELLEKITTHEYDQSNELWMPHTDNGEQYYIYSQKYMNGNRSEYVAAALREKEIEWSFFNFFKLFIVHSGLLLLAYLFSAGFRLWKSKTLEMRFRTQLMNSFLVVSVIPVIVLAFYNHYNIEGKSTQAIRASLRNQLTTVETHLAAKLKSNLPLELAIEECGEEVGVQFSLFKSNQLLYSTEWNIYQAGVLPDRLPLSANLAINYNHNKEYFGLEESALLNTYSFYRQINPASGGPLILSVTDGFNYVAGVFSPVENDVFLFGIYSFAIFFIIALSSLLAERIAAPVRSLTLATRMVAKGDISVTIENNAQGEMSELINGFNAMTGELQRAQDELANFERESAWKDFARQVAHEIKNPLTPMKLTLQQLVASYNDKAPNFESIFQKVTSTVLHQIEALSAIASEFSSFARMPAARYSTIDLIELLNETITLFYAEKVVITLDTNAITSAKGTGDASQLRRSFINIVRNAIEARATTINILFSLTGNSYIIAIADNGTGLPAGQEENIFNKNYTTKLSGMGLGLSIARKIIDSTGGSITAKNNPGGGTIFTIIYPVEKS